MGYSLVRDVSPDFQRNATMVTNQAHSIYLNHKKITDVIPSHAWEGKPCFIIGGGESLKGFDFHRLDGKLSIGVNRSFEFYQSTVLYMMDVLFHNMLLHSELDRFSKTDVSQKWADFNGVKTLLCPASPCQIDDSVYLVKRLEQHAISLDVADGVFGGSNSGFGALMLAIALGASPIYLLGYDLKCDKATHWHSGYPNQTHSDQQRKNESFRAMFIEFSDAIGKMGFKVINLNKDSALTCFEFGNIDEVLPL